MKKLKQKIAVLLALCCGVGAFAGCKKGVSEEEKAQTLYVASINKGYGTDWLKALLEKFCGDRNLKYKLIPAYEDNAIKSVVESGKGYCDYDLVFTGSRNGIGDEYLADLTSLVTEYKIESGDRQGKTIKELLGDELADTFNEEYLFDGEYYNVLPWTKGMTSLIFNVNVMKETFGENWKEQYPCRTTDELLECCQALASTPLLTQVTIPKTAVCTLLYGRSTRALRVSKISITACITTKPRRNTRKVLQS